MKDNTFVLRFVVGIIKLWYYLTEFKKSQNRNDMKKYSVLMATYKNDNAQYLEEALQSMFAQSYLPDEIVLVCDGPLGDDLEYVIKKHIHKLKVVRLNSNKGLGIALSYGIKVCENEYIIRMDSDDVSMPDRCQRQMQIMDEGHYDIVGGTILEFSVDIHHITGKRKLPVRTEDIIRFSKKRNPFNHPAVAFRKSAVLAAGNYNGDYHLFEDYDLWIRMLKNNCKGYNIEEPLLYMRAPTDIYRRRGGIKYAREMLRFHFDAYKSGWEEIDDFIFGALTHAVVCVLPICIRRMIYNILH